MDLRTVLSNNLNLQSLVQIAVKVIFIALVFEFIAWWAGRQIEKKTAPMIPIDGAREASWRVRRRTTLRQTPKIISRSCCYVVALLLVLNQFNVEILPLSIGLGAVALMFGAALLPLMRDAAQGYALLGEDVLAPGDIVEVAGVRGQVEKFTLRALWLRDAEKHVHCFSNRSVRDVTILQRREESARSVAMADSAAVPAQKTPRAAGFDPLDAA